MGMLHSNFHIFKGVIVLMIAMVLNMMTLLQIPYIHGEEELDTSSGVEFMGINIEPSDIHQGDYITVNATVINNSAAPITYRSGCESPIWLTFSSSNVEVFETFGCQGFALIKIEPGQSATIKGPGDGVFYKAISYGTIDAEVNFAYGVGEGGEEVVPSKIISKTIVLKIDSGKEEQSEFPFENNNEKIVREIFSPHKQVLSGINPQDVICSKGLELIIKSTDNSPACVKSSTAEKLIKRGWAKS